jgi:uncharacterized 2Fe-2S/4Fe-4S cluster protein (DUF4445 family)
MIIIMETLARYNVRFEPDHTDVVVNEGTNLMEAAISAGVHINASCGGAGTCGTCNVMIIQGHVESNRTNKVIPADYDKGIRQSCQSRVMSDLVVEIPPDSRLETSVLSQEKDTTSAMGQTIAIDWTFAPAVEKRFLELTPPSLGDNASDLSRLLRCIQKSCNIAKIETDFGVVKKLAAVVRAADWKVTVTFLDDNGLRRLINIESGDTRGTNYSLAFDIGTTAVRGQLLDLSRGRVLAQAIEYNGQISYGADVISRISQCGKPGGTEKLQKAVVDTLNKLIEEMTGKAQVNIKGINHVVVAANTVMVHLLLGLDPQYLRLSPYVPTTSQPPLVKALDLGIDLLEHVHVFTVPSVASYVGGDIVAGILGSGIYQRNKTTLYIDIGTNGEIVVGNRDWMVTSAASAGPTFEGGGIKCGMLATSGAIEDFELDAPNGEPRLRVIGEVKPAGICGSGIINMAAAMLRTLLVSQDGKYNTDALAHRIRQGEDGYEYLLVTAQNSATGKDIVFTEIDMTNLIRAKAALYAGYQTLAESIGARMSNIDEIIIAGTFGSRLNMENAITIGLLPDMPRDKFVFIGNGSLLGARLISFSGDLLRESRLVAAMMTNLELSESVDFMNNYVAAMFLPHTDASLFPSIKLGGPG